MEQRLVRVILRPEFEDVPMTDFTIYHEVILILSLVGDNTYASS